MHSSSTPAGLRGRLAHELGRIRVRLVVVNLLVLLVPVAGLEFARVYERQLLVSLQRDMENQATLVRALVEADLARDVAVGQGVQRDVITRAAARTRTRIRLLDAEGALAADSHDDGPPEGPEPPPPSLLPDLGSTRSDVRRTARSDTTERWPEVHDRTEVRTALGGRRAAHTRVRDRAPGVLLFVAEPVLRGGEIEGVVYVVRSTRPAMIELYAIRAGLVRVLFVAMVFAAILTLLLAWSISRPLARLSRAAKRVAAGERDVTIPTGGGGEIRELGESFRAMKDRLDSRLRYIKDFSADVAHEFKSPLTSIRGAAELLGEGAADEPAARARFLHNIELDVERLDRLVSRLLELSRIEASSEEPSVLDLEALTRRVAARLQKPGHAIEVHGALDSRFVRAREADLEAALSNLVDNALRFSPPGAPVQIALASGEGSVRVEVTDTGPGIEPSLLPRIFDRFFTTDAERHGTGLGLAIVVSVAESHGGRVRVRSAPGEGATFTIELLARVAEGR